MNIILLEGDEAQHQDGKPRYIYLSINGKKQILPTSKTILELLDIGKGIEPSKEPIVEISPLKPPHDEVVEEPSKPIDRSMKIEREDLVKCIFVQPRLSDQSGNELDKSEMVLGVVYRVLKISQTGISGADGNLDFIANFYEVIDDNSPTPRRIIAFPNEVALFQKRKSRKIGKGLKFSEIFKCECGTENAVILDEAKNKYMGICSNPDCLKALELDRPQKKEMMTV